MQNRFVTETGAAAPLAFTKRMVACGATDAVCFETFRQLPNSILAPSGYAATFPSASAFVRDPFLGVPMCAGLSVFAARVPPHWEKKRHIPDAEVAAARTRVNKLVPDESPRAPRWNEHETEWTPGLGRGGFVGLFNYIPADQTCRWFVVVQNSPDESTLVDFEDHLCALQRDGATFASSTSSFAALQALAEKSREKLAVMFAAAIGASLVSAGAAPAEPPRDENEDENERGEKVREWLGDLCRAVPAEFRVPRRAPRFVPDEDFSAVRAWAGDVVEMRRARTRAGAGAAPAPEWTVTWNTLRESAHKATTTWFSDCVGVGAGAGAGGATVVPELGDAHAALVLRLVERAAAQTITVPVICAPLAAEDAAAASVSASVSDDVFNSDADLECGRAYGSETKKLTSALDRHALNQKMVLFPLLVRVSNRDYTGRVRRTGAGAPAGAGAPDPEREVDYERLVRAMFAVPDDEYVAPA